VSRRSQSSFKKRQKEIQRQERRQDKMARRLERNRVRQEHSSAQPEGVDPDIAGIVPGPQPPQED
jgi:hypothetical protein